MIEQIKELYFRHKEVINYLIVGGMTTLVSLLTYYGLVLTVLDPENPVQLQAATVISWIAAVSFAYVTNRKFVFESKRTDIKKEAASFVAARIGTLLMEMALMFLMVSVMHINDKIAKLVVQVLIIIANYVLSKLFVFRS
ncbi:MAG: GtrA family protein [Lachnospiraceae bacterium]|nr:GtrA family protein [Lachnospiraceae bacterium]